MDERRKNKRVPIQLALEVNQIFKQDNEVIGDLKAELEVVNISKTGIGFYSMDDLPLGYYFNAKLEFDEKNYIFTVVKIIRKSIMGDTFDYGCEFVGMADFLIGKIQEYENKQSE